MAVLAQNAEPKDPIELQNYLFIEGTNLIRPYLLLDGVPAKNANDIGGQADLEKGIAVLERVLDLNKKNWSAAWFAGKAAQCLKDNDRAYRFFERAYAIQKHNPDVARELMIACLDSKRTREAVDVAEFAVQINDVDPSLKANLALALLCAGDLDRADVAIDAALKSDPQDKINIALKRIIGEVRRGTRKQPTTPADLTN
jgi:Flp pilus assembly protein TadD